MTEALINAISNLDEEQVTQLVQEQLDSGSEPQAILADCRDGMADVGKRYEAGEYYVSELIMAGELFKQANALLAPHFAAGGGATKGKVVIATVKGDIHDIGKDIVVGMLKATGYEVLDLGVDVPVEKIVAAVKESGAKVVGLSGLITLSFDSMKATIAALEAAGLRKDVKVMVGGGSLTEMVREYVGADALGADAQSAVQLCNQWI